MKLEVGMYVKFKKGKITYIRRLLEVIHNYEEFNVYRTAGEYFDYEEKDYFDIIYPNEIMGKPSYNIIDLIEVGDYVNGHKVILVNTTFTYASVNVETSGEATCEVIPKPAIKSIVTHEQFESMKYEVE